MIRSFRDLRIEFTQCNGSQFRDVSVAPFTYYLQYAHYLGTGSTIASVTGGMSITGSGTTVNPLAYIDAGYLYLLTNPIIGHKYYIRLKAKVTNSICQAIRVVYGGVTQTMVSTPTSGTTYDVAFVVTATATTDELKIDHTYTSTANANGKVMEVYGLDIIDLTADCGSGSEYTAAQTTAILDANTLPYFVGTYSFSLNDWNSLGDKVIQPVSCIETISDNDEWKIEVKAGLEYLDYMRQDYILVAPTKEKSDQPFRINNIKVDDFYCYVTARHVGYDLENYLCKFQFGYSYTSNTLTHLRLAVSLAYPQPPFTISGDTALSGRVIYKEPTLLGNLNEIIATLGGHLTFNWWNVDISSTVGEDNGVVVEEGKNLNSSEMYEDYSQVCTVMYPVGNNNLTLPMTGYFKDSLLFATGVSYDRPYYKRVNFQTDDVTELTTLGNAYLEKYKVPKINYKIEADTIQTIGIGDTIVAVTRNFTVSTNVLGYTYNVLSSRVETIEFGNYKRDVRTAFNAITADIADLKKSVIQENITMNDSLGLGILAYKSTSTTVNAVGTSGGITKYVLDSSEHNTDSTIFEITGGSVKVKKAGLYLVTAMVSITSGTSGKRINSLVSVNGGTARSLSSIGQVASDACRATGTIVLNLNANDTLDLSIYNSDTASKTSAAGVDFNYLCITKQ